MSSPQAHRLNYTYTPLTWLLFADSVIWDPWKKEYVLYTRNWIRTSPKYRTVRRLACKDLSVSTLADCWQDQEIVMAPDAIDSNPPGQPGGQARIPGGAPALDYYGAVVWPYTASVDPLYFMFTQRTWHWEPEKAPVPEQVASGMPEPAMIDVGLAVSHDGINFTHIGGREAFIGPQASGAFDSKFQWMLPYPVVKEDGEIFYYYSGSNRNHNGEVDGDKHRSGIGLAVGRQDGLVSLDTPLRPELR